MASSFISITQGSAGVIEDNDGTLGFFSEKIETCRVSVFKCSDATLLIHDTAQICIKELCDFISQYGTVSSIKYAVGLDSNKLHVPRLKAIAKVLKFPLSVTSSIPVSKKTYAVAHAEDIGFVEADPRYFRLLHDPNEKAREAVNILNDWFTPPNSQTAPLDVQFRRYEFTPPPAPKITVLEMLRDLRNDTLHGLLGASALGHYGPLAGLKLPPELQTFLANNGLTEACYNNLPKDLLDKGSKYQQLAAKFAQLPIFT